MDPGAAAAFTGDGVTAVAASHNAAWLLAFRVFGHAPSRRRTAAATVAALNAGIALQAAYAQALYSAHRFDLDAAALFAPGSWLASRALLLAGTVALAMFITRSRAHD